MDYKDKIYDVWEELSISNDFLFGKVMQDAQLCRELLQRILPELDIDHIEYPELQKGIKPDMDAKSVRLDVYVRDGKGTVYDIEMQVANTKELQEANCVVAVAGMEGAFASVVGGLVDKPVIAVPTSVGYGASMHGLSALLTMINSCANGIAVVNIDNGYGAGYLASQINRMGS